MVPKWPKPHPRRLKVGANEGNERTSGRITHGDACMRRIHMTVAVRVRYIRLEFPVTLAGGMVGSGHTYALFERCGSVLEAIRLGN